MENIEERLNSLYESGEYEQLYDLVEYDPIASSNPEFAGLKDECKILIGEQYIYRIQEQIDNGNFLAASAIREKFIQKYGHRTEIDDFDKQIQDGIKRNKTIDDNSKKVAPIVSSSKNGTTKEKKNLGVKNNFIAIIAGTIMVLFVLIIYCSNKRSDTQPIDQNQYAVEYDDYSTTEDTISEIATYDDYNDSDYSNESLDEYDTETCSAIRNFLLGKSDNVVLNNEEDLLECSWPEAQCSVDGTLYSPIDARNLTVKDIGNGRYRFECECPEHGDKYIDSRIITANYSINGQALFLEVN